MRPRSTRGGRLGPTCAAWRQPRAFSPARAAAAAGPKTTLGREMPTARTNSSQSWSTAANNSRFGFRGRVGFKVRVSRRAVLVNAAHGAHPEGFSSRSLRSSRPRIACIGLRGDPPKHETGGGGNRESAKTAALNQ